MNPFLSLNDIQPGQTARVTELLVSGAMRRRLMDLGLTADTQVECLGVSPLGDPVSYRIRVQSLPYGVNTAARSGWMETKIRTNFQWLCPATPM